jgi:hypothetical protein
MRLNTKSLLALVALILAGCFAPPIQPQLWKASGSTEVPAAIEIREPLVFSDAKTRESFVVPAGRYVLWYQNKFGYDYRQEGTKIQRTNAKGIVDEFEGGLELAKRVDIITLYELVSLADGTRKYGEIAHLAAFEAGDKDGFTRNWVVNLPRHFYPTLGFPEYQMPGTDR